MATAEMLSTKMFKRRDPHKALFPMLVLFVMGIAFGLFVPSSWVSNAEFLGNLLCVSAFGAAIVFFAQDRKKWKALSLAVFALATIIELLVIVRFTCGFEIFLVGTPTKTIPDILKDDVLVRDIIRKLCYRLVFVFTMAISSYLRFSGRSHWWGIALPSSISIFACEAIYIVPRMTVLGIMAAEVNTLAIQLGFQAMLAAVILTSAILFDWVSSFNGKPLYLRTGAVIWVVMGLIVCFAGAAYFSLDFAANMKRFEYILFAAIAYLSYFTLLLRRRTGIAVLIFAVVFGIMSTLEQAITENTTIEFLAALGCVVLPAITWLIISGSWKDNAPPEKQAEPKQAAAKQAAANNFAAQPIASTGVAAVAATQAIPAQIVKNNRKPVQTPLTPPMATAQFAVQKAQPAPLANTASFVAPVPSAKPAEVFAGANPVASAPPSPAANSGMAPILSAKEQKKLDKENQKAEREKQKQQHKESKGNKSLPESLPADGIYQAGFCGKCGQQVHEGARFCMMCGTKRDPVMDFAKGAAETGVSEAPKLPEAQPGTAKQQEIKRVYTELDNRGTMHKNVGQATSYWIMRRPTMKSKPPFLLYIFKDKDSARRALQELSYIHSASDSGELICDYLMEYGYYELMNDGDDIVCYEALVCGHDLTAGRFAEAKASFEKNGGIIKNEQIPDPNYTVPDGPVDVKAITFKEDFVDNGKYKYHVFFAPNRASAIEFLRQNRVEEEYVYIMVETPDGAYGRDIDGMYEV